MSTLFEPEQSRPLPATRPAEAQDTPAEKLHQMLTVLWERSKPAVLDRVQTLRGVQKELAEGRLDDTARMAGLDSAHKLAGVLGTFGMPRGTELARQAEDMLSELGETGGLDQARLGALLDQLDHVIANRPLDPAR